MDTEKPADATPTLSVFNYCVGFLDILGQRHALRDQGLLHEASNPTEEDRQRFIREVLTNTILPIKRLQSQTNIFIEKFQTQENSPVRESLPPELRKEWDKLQGHELRVQYWSDGLVAFSSLGNKQSSVQLNGAFALLGMAGSLCFMNLGHQFHNPIRGGIEIAWGIELKPGELYGPAIARSYELESEVAQYPRIVVGARMIEFLNVHAALPQTDNVSRYSATMASKCLSMLIKDFDGKWMIHYLGGTFREAVSRNEHVDMYNDALRFISEEYDRFRNSGDSKLAARYFHLLSYFRYFPPKAPA